MEKKKNDISQLGINFRSSNRLGFSHPTLLPFNKPLTKWTFYNHFNKLPTSAFLFYSFVKTSNNWIDWEKKNNQLGRICTNSTILEKVTKGNLQTNFPELAIIRSCLLSWYSVISSHWPDIAQYHDHLAKHGYNNCN